MEIVLPIRFSSAFFKLIRYDKIELEEVSKHFSQILSQPNHEGLVGIPFTVPTLNLGKEVKKSSQMKTSSNFKTIS